MTLNWKGDEVKKKMMRSVSGGLNETAKEAQVYALNHHPQWQYRTGVAEGSIGVKTFATPSKLRVLWGSIWTTARKKLTKAGKAHTTNYVWYLEFYHGSFLRNAADVEYKDLIKRIKKRFNR